MKNVNANKWLRRFVIVVKNLFFVRCKNRCSWIWIAVFLIFGLLISFPSFAIEYGGFGGRPANPDSSNPRTESIFIYNLNLGDKKDDAVLVVNNTKETKTLLVYAVDSEHSSGGGFACSQFLDQQKEVGTWVKLAKKEVTLEPTKTEAVSFVVNVPKNAPVGESNGCIMVQEKKEAPKNQSGVNLLVRTGMRMAITVPGEIVRKLEIAGFEKLPVKNNLNVYNLHPLVKNLGNVSIDADIKAKLKNIFGVTITENGGQHPVLRGETSDWNFEAKKPFWGGWYKAVLEVSYDANKEASVGIESGKELTKLERPAIWFFVMPKTNGLIVQGLIAFFILFAGFLYWFYQERKKWIAKSWIDYEIKQGDDIKNLAKKFDVSWKILAGVNKLKAPYVLGLGDKIKVPPKEKKDEKSKEK